jgi:hypothetical protein
MFLEMAKHASLLKPACFTSWTYGLGRERGGLRQPHVRKPGVTREALISFRDSSGSHCPLHGSQNEACAAALGWNAAAVSHQHPSLHTSTP